jgi:hypothetical protein
MSICPDPVEYRALQLPWVSQLSFTCHRVESQKQLIHYYPATKYLIQRAITWICGRHMIGYHEVKRRCK